MRKKILSAEQIIRIRDSEYINNTVWSKLVWINSKSPSKNLNKTIYDHQHNGKPMSLNFRFKMTNGFCEYLNELKKLKRC